MTRTPLRCATDMKRYSSLVPAPPECGKNDNDPSTRRDPLDRHAVYSRPGVCLRRDCVIAVQYAKSQVVEGKAGVQSGRQRLLMSRLGLEATVRHRVGTGMVAKPPCFLPIAQPGSMVLSFDMTEGHRSGGRLRGRQDAEASGAVHLEELVGVRVNRQHDVPTRQFLRIFRNSQGDCVPRTANRTTFSWSIIIRLLARSPF